MKIVLGLLFLSAVALAGDKARSVTPDRADRPAKLAFEYRSNLEPFPVSSCTHRKSDVGEYEWDVVCDVRGEKRKFGVHLALTRYAKTSLGNSAYELLYWVTEWRDPSHPETHSSTLWLHNREAEGTFTVVEASQGVEHDLASLQLTIDLR